jgi:hypothetical protein
VIFADVCPDFGKPGPTKTVGMDKQSGRRDNKTLREVGADEFDLTEELDLHVDGAVKEGLKFSNTGGAPGWSKAKATDDAYAGKGNKVKGCHTDFAAMIDFVFIIVVGG